MLVHDRFSGFGAGCWIAATWITSSAANEDSAPNEDRLDSALKQGLPLANTSTCLKDPGSK
jgi:hypothetical protein